MQCIEQIYRHDDWWDEINWSQMERDVRKLQGRIYRASKKSDNKRVDNLMKLLVRSEKAKLLAIYIITQKNKGKATPGIDGKVCVTSRERMELSKEDFDYKTYKFQPIIRRYIPKTQENWRARIYNSKRRKYDETEMRPLGIMTIKDRVMTTIISFALTAKWEALLESNVMGFRPGRCTQDAIQRIHLELIKGRMIILDTDINKFFDNIKHNAILSRVRVFRKVLYRCLNAGIIEKGKRIKTIKGIIQGSPISPILANIALNGIQEALGKDICVITYADDLIIIVPSVATMKKMIPKLAKFLKERGLYLKREKTRVTTKKEGFNFLGFRIEQPRRKLYIKPQKEKVKTFLSYIREIIWTNKQMEQKRLIAKLNPVIRGWAMYYRYSDANKAFNWVDHEINGIIWKWALRRHSKKGKRWIYAKYFDLLGQDKWTFRDARTGYTLLKTSKVQRLKYDFIVQDLSPLNPDPIVKKIWENRQYQEIRHAMT